MAKRLQIQSLALILLLLMSSCAICLAQDSGGFDFEQDTPRAKNIILVIADGMQLENEIAASRYLFGTDFSLSWHNFPYYTWVSTWDIDSYNRYARNLGREMFSPDSFDPLVGYDPSRGGAAPYPVDQNGDRSYFLNALPTWSGGSETNAVPATDSASAATAMATGNKTDQGNVSWMSGDPENGALTTIAEFMRDENGSAIGVVTTVQFSHATPAAFMAHNRNRGNPGYIAHEMIHETRPDVVIGGGHPNWHSDYISTANLNTLRNSDEYVFVERVEGQDGGDALLDAADRAVADGMKLFGLFGGGRGNFITPEPTDTPGSPGCTDDDENPSLAEAVESALMVLSEDPDGFFLAVEQGDLDWGNHYGNYHMMIGSMWELEETMKTVIGFIDRPGDDIDWENTLLIVTSDHATGYLRLSDDITLGAGDLPEMTGENYHHGYPGGEISYAVGQHTNELVMLYARGAGRELFSQYEGFWYPNTRIIDNTHIFRVMFEAAGLAE